jgi:hypothetical protein
LELVYSQILNPTSRRRRWEAGGGQEAQEGDAVEVLHPANRGFKGLFGRIERLVTSADGSRPTKGSVVLARPFEGAVCRRPCSELVRLLTAQEWRAAEQRIRDRLPHDLLLLHYKKKPARDGVRDSELMRRRIADGAVFQLTGEEAEVFQLSVEVLDSEKNVLKYAEWDREQVVQPRHLLVQVDLLDDAGRPVQDPKSKKPWSELVRAEGDAKYSTAPNAVHNCTPLAGMLKLLTRRRQRAFRLAVSLQDYGEGRDGGHHMRDMLDRHLATVTKTARFEIAAGVSPVGAPNRFRFMSLRMGESSRFWVVLVGDHASVCDCVRVLGLVRLSLLSPTYSQSQSLSRLFFDSILP